MINEPTTESEQSGLSRKQASRVDSLVDALLIVAVVIFLISVFSMLTGVQS